MSSADDFSKAVDITKQLGTHAKRMVKPKDIPIYGEISAEVIRNVGEPGILLTSAKEARLAVQTAYTQIESVVSPIKDSAIGVVDTGKAHAQTTYQMIQEQQNSTINAAVIGGSGLLGFIVASFAKRARLLKRLIYTSAGVGVSASICYPSEGEAIASSFVEETNRLGLIAYNFVQGVQPNQKLSLAIESSVKTKEVTANGDLGQGSPDDKDMYSTKGS